LNSRDGRQLQSHVLEYGSKILIGDGESVKADTVLASWDNNNRVILTEKAGQVSLVDMIENVTVQESYNNVSKRRIFVVLDYKGDKYQPGVSIVNSAGEEVAQYFLPTGSEVAVEQGQQVYPGMILAKIPREIAKSRDIAVGALPRIAELFEARMPKMAAILSDIDGEVVIKGLVRGLRRISVVNHATGESFDYFIPREKQLNVAHGDKVSAGDALTPGSLVPQDLLRILGVSAVQHYLLNEIQEIYRHQGVNINDRHIELIIRQMLRKVRIFEMGDTDFLVGDRVDKIHLEEINKILELEGKKSAKAKPILMGITIASVGTESFLSAASFQETTRILAEAALAGQVDYLYGLKENVIIGRLIPAGTGIPSFREHYMGNKEPNT
jgi:DNA-directed RNA polymerase subunit beta'